MSKIAFLFSGQGAQYPGMMVDLASECPEAGNVFDTADRVLGRSVSRLCFEGSQEDLNLTHNTQPCVLAADLAAWTAVSVCGIQPDAVAGFSLGEYAALAAAGVISLEDVFPLIQQRADLMQAAVPVGQGAMAAVMKLGPVDVEQLCGMAEGYVVPANYNCPGQIVVSGESEAVDRLIGLVKEKKGRAVRLAVSAPFHCDLMAPAAEGLEKALAGIRLGMPKVPVYMNVDGQPETDPVGIERKMVLQARSPVRWEESLRNMAAGGIDTFVELGPGKTLSGFVGKTFVGRDDIRILSVSDKASWRETVSVLCKEQKNG